MELYMKNNLSDITYTAELILDTKPNITKINLSCQGSNSHNNLLALCARKLCAH